MQQPPVCHSTRRPYVCTGKYASRSWRLLLQTNISCSCKNTPQREEAEDILRIIHYTTHHEIPHTIRNPSNPVVKTQRKWHDDSPSQNKRQERTALKEPQQQLLHECDKSRVWQQRASEQASSDPICRKMIINNNNNNA
jgi:hypothetical protein